MYQEQYDDVVDYDDELDADFIDEIDEDDGDVEDDVDSMLEAMMDEDYDEEDEDGVEDYSERRFFGRRARRRAQARARKKAARGRAVRTARGKSAYRTPVSKKHVTHPQLKSALGRVGKDIRRNAIGIKSVNKRIGGLNGRVNGVVSVNRVQSRKIGKLGHQMKLDGALEFAESISTNDDGSLSLNLLPMLKGAVKSGMLGGSKGALSSPAVVGGLGFLLSNPQIFGGLLKAN
jgi:hypothetical protein